MPGKQQGHWWIQKANKKQVLQVNKYKKTTRNFIQVISSEVYMNLHSHYFFESFGSEGQIWN